MFIRECEAQGIGFDALEKRVEEFKDWKLWRKILENRNGRESPRRSEHGDEESVRRILMRPRMDHSERHVWSQPVRAGPRPSRVNNII